MGETNQQMWRGVRPVHPEEVFTRFEPPEGGIYVDAHNSTGIGEVTVYSVPANRLFFLTSYGVSIYGTAAGTGYVRTYTNVPAVHRYLHACKILANGGIWLTANLNMAMQLPAGYTFRIDSSGAGLNVVAWVNGYLRIV